MIRLGDIVNLDGADAGLAAHAVAGVAFDSRKVRPGDIFFALAGAKDDGLTHAADAVARGAAAVVTERDATFTSVPTVRVDDARLALARAAARLASVG